WVTWRARVSVAPPGGNATTRRMGRSGYDDGACACAKAAAPSKAHAAKPHRKRLRMVPASRLRRPVHCPVIGKPIGSRAGFCVDWFEPCNKDIIVAGDAYMFASSQSPM